MSLDEYILKLRILQCVIDYMDDIDFHSSNYQKWVETRKKTLRDLESLITRVHNDQLKYNRSQLKFGPIGVISRCVSLFVPPFSIAARSAAVLNNAVSAVTFGVQTASIDSFQVEFQEIAKSDQEATKKMCDARNRCVARYEEIKQILEKEFPTFKSTVSNIINRINLDDLRIITKCVEDIEEIASNYDLDSLWRILSDVYVNNRHIIQNLRNMADKIITYSIENPAALLSLFKGGQAAVGGIVAAAFEDSVTLKADAALLLLDIQHCYSYWNIDENTSQSTLEDRLKSFSDILRWELEKVVNLAPSPK